jgi:hypothetical protein
MKKLASKNSAYESGMRGAQKPKVQSGNGQGEAGTMGNDGAAGGESSQAPGKTIGDPKGVGLDAYSSGMRGVEKPKQKSPDAATQATGDQSGSGSSLQGANTSVGIPKGDNSEQQTVGKSLADAEAEKRGTSAYKLGVPGNNTEHAAAGHEPSFEEDDTHFNIRVPKTSFKRRQPGLNGN